MTSCDEAMHNCTSLRSTSRRFASAWRPFLRRLTACILAALVGVCRAAAQPSPAPVEIANRSLAEIASTPARDAQGRPLQIAGIYPHLCAFNGHGECGIGAVVPWAGRLWWITYPPHMRRGSNDKLYSIDESLLLTIHPESVGGTHAARMIHEPSDQLLLGPYVISHAGQVRALDVQNIPGRYTAWATHLTDPDEKAYLFDMEGPIWEVDVRTLAGRRLFVKPAPGWHGKGAYTGQNRLVIANNGEHSAAGDLPREWELPREKWPSGGEHLGVLAEYDGTEWRIVQRRQFVEVTGPRGIRGTFRPGDPLWAIGWDRRSVLLALCDEGEWSLYRLPKASHAMDPSHGWYTEWPRLREVSQNRALLCMHGMFYDFPLDFHRSNAFGIRPIASHLRYVPDFCGWNDRLVLAADDVSLLENPLAGQSQSNLWFGRLDDLHHWGAGSGYGGVWLGDDVPAETPSDPYLFAGFRGRMLHLAAAGGEPVDVMVEIDREGTGQWEVYGAVTIPSSGYTWRVFEDNEPGEWMRLSLSRPARVSAYFHYAAAEHREHPQDRELFAALRDNSSPGEPVLVRPSSRNGRLELLCGAPPQPGSTTAASASVRAFELDGRMELTPLDDPAVVSQSLALLQAPAPAAMYDAVSAIVVTHDGRRLRLPRVPGTSPFGRDLREVQSERSLAHIGNIFYEVPRGELGKHILEYRKMRPVAAHRQAISDFCNWRGMLVLAGVRDDAPLGGRIFGGAAGPKVWLGMVDDLWRLGKPVGEGGPWKDSPVAADVPSDPYLMTGFDRKRLALSHDADHPVRFRVEIDYSQRDFWKEYRTISVPPGETVEHQFPAGYSAHWVRLVADRDCRATAWLRYE